MQNLKPFSRFLFFFTLAFERIFIKTRSTEIRRVTGPENIRVRAVFSPEIWQAMADFGGSLFFCSKSQRLGAQPCWSTLYRWTAENGWFVTWVHGCNTCQMHPWHQRLDYNRSTRRRILGTFKCRIWINFNIYLQKKQTFFVFVLAHSHPKMAVSLLSSFHCCFSS